MKKHLNSSKMGPIDACFWIWCFFHSLDMPEKGFSFSKIGPLDMRIGPNKYIDRHKKLLIHGLNRN